jgi:putative ABC transport system permease protein
LIEELLLGAFGIVLFIIIIHMLRNRVISKMGIRNILRRKVYAAIVILGLMIGTGVISSSLVIGDTMENMIETEIIKSYHKTDEIITGTKPNGETVYFNFSVFNQVKNGFSRSYIDGLSPAINDYVAVLNLETNLSEPRVAFYGVDFDNAENFGAFINIEGEEVNTLSDDEIMLGENTANDLDAMVGHKIMIYASTLPVTLEITHILKTEERAGSGNGIYVNLNKAQLIINKPGKINRILISNKGDVIEGMEYTSRVIEEFKSIDLSDSLNYNISFVKKEILEEGKQNLEQFSNLFTIFGTFSIIAGIILIVNIFVMLAEERKSEMGMSRAIGMQKDQLKKMYVFEGTIYAISASLVGVFFGIFIGYIIIYALEDIFNSFGSITILEYFSFEANSLIIGFISGFFLTITTIYLTSNRISKLNIVRAIREIPEPKISRINKRIFLIGSLIIIIGLLLILLGIATENITPLLSGLSILIFGSGLIIRRWIGDRIAFNLVGILILVEWTIPSSLFPDYSGGMELFIISGLFMVLASLLIVMFNSESIISGLTFILGRGKSRQAVIRTAISYSLKSKFRTGMTIAIFALVIFTITTMSMLVGIIGTNIEKQIEQASGGYEIIAFSNKNTPIQDLESDIENIGLDDTISSIASPVSGRAKLNINNTEISQIYYTIIGLDDSFINENKFAFSKILDEYTNEKEVWQAIKTNKSLIIIDSSVYQSESEVTMQFGGPQFSSFTIDLGETIEIFDKDSKLQKKKVVAVLDTAFIQGIFSYDEFVKQDFGFNSSNYFLINVNENVNVEDTAKKLESSFLKNGMYVIAVESMVMEVIKTMNQFFYLFDAFMGLGLIIGIAGLGIITIRSVHERRQEIGMMRAIGFKRRMILQTFVIETSMVALIGIIIGTILGIFTGYIIWRDGFEALDFDFVINWQPIVIMFLIAFIFTMICIFPASRKASKIPPAEALRYKG